MLQIVYISSAAPGFESQNIDQILASARKNNSANHITGLLFHDGVRFLQALEGEDALVWQTYSRILEDPRHRAVVQLSQRQIDKREFGSWAMAAQKVGGGNSEELIAEVDRLVADLPDPNIREQFRSFARIRRAA
ncbi:MAG: BLUF domain-containing protein [Sphingomonadaceae bacterium]